MTFLRDVMVIGGFVLVFVGVGLYDYRAGMVVAGVISFIGGLLGILKAR